MFAARLSSGSTFMDQTCSPNPPESRLGSTKCLPVRLLKCSRLPSIAGRQTATIDASFRESRVRR